MGLSIDIPADVVGLVERAAAGTPLATDAPAEAFTRRGDAPAEPIYENRYPAIGIDFSVERVNLPGIQTMDPRIVRIAAGQTNELHKHAHESIFVVLSGQGIVRVGEHEQPVARGDLAFVPRWALHQTRNTSDTEPLELLAITDFGFTKAVLGDYTKKTRKKRTA